MCVTGWFGNEYRHVVVIPDDVMLATDICLYVTGWCGVGDRQYYDSMLQDGVALAAGPC